ncbi:MAG: YtxH domain-containing protein [Cyclobacteriaceae bacterium]
MKIGKQTFRFGKKKKKNIFPSLEALKNISFITGSALAINRALKEKLHEQQSLLQRQKKKKSDNTGAFVAGFIGGLLTGSIAALLLAPESGEKLRERVNGFFLNDEGEVDLQEILEQAQHKAKAELGLNGNN